jgi:DNA-binding response OmpR family regulator
MSSSPTNSAAPVGAGSSTAPSRTVLVFSDDPTIRAQIRSAVGRRPAPDIGRIEYVECADQQLVVDELDAGGIDLVILDGEAQPTGGMGICRQLKNEIDPCPPIMIVVARHDDRWLARWSLADGVVTYPIDPVTAAETVAKLLRSGAVVGVPH